MVKTLDMKKIVLVKTNKIDHFNKSFSLGSMNEVERLNTVVCLLNDRDMC